MEKKYKVKCKNCGRIREVGYSQRRYLEKGKGKGKCRHCRHYRNFNTIKLHNVVCPICDKVRQLNYKAYWAIKSGNNSGVCFKCSRFKKGETNSGGLKKGHIPWNKGNGEYDYWVRVKRSKKWKDMRKAVFERDDYTCQWCDERGGELHPDHIKPKSVYPELAFNMDNIRTLCVECHRKTDTYGYKAVKLKNKTIKIKCLIEN